MNQVALIGRLTRDPEMRYTADQKAVTNFTLAVNRAYKKDEADFLRIVVWGNQAESVSKYLKRGSQCAVMGSIQTGSYQDNDGKTVYTTDINAQRVEFLGSGTGKKEDQDNHQKSYAPEDFPEIDDDDVPF